MLRKTKNKFGLIVRIFRYLHHKQNKMIRTQLHIEKKSGFSPVMDYTDRGVCCAID